MFGGTGCAEDVIITQLEHWLIPSDNKFSLWVFSLNHFKDLAQSCGLLRIDCFVVISWGVMAAGRSRAAGVHNQCVGMGLREAVILAQVGNLLWILLVLDFLHDFKPVGHLFAVALFNSGEVRFAGRIFRHGLMVIAPVSTISTL